MVGNKCFEKLPDIPGSLEGPGLGAQLNETWEDPKLWPLADFQIVQARREG